MSERPKIHQEPLLCSGLGVSYRQVHVWLHRRDKFLRPSVTPQAPPPGAGRNHKPTSASGGGGGDEVDHFVGRGLQCVGGTHRKGDESRHGHRGNDRIEKLLACGEGAHGPETEQRPGIYVDVHAP
jgi:hypothetical protein